MKRLNPLIIIALTSLLFACDNPSNDKKEVKGVIPQYQLKALEDAKAVQKTRQEAEAKRKEAMEQIENN